MQLLRGTFVSIFCHWNEFHVEILEKSKKEIMLRHQWLQSDGLTGKSTPIHPMEASQLKGKKSA